MFQESQSLPRCGAFYDFQGKKGLEGTNGLAYLSGSCETKRPKFLDVDTWRPLMFSGMSGMSEREKLNKKLLLATLEVRLLNKSSCSAAPLCASKLMAVTLVIFFALFKFELDD